ncbi:hypothetical protein [Ekhidna sp.]
MKSESKQNQSDTSFWNSVKWTFGAFVFALGIMNILRGNDPALGVAMLFASALYFPPSYDRIKGVTGISLHYFLRIVLALLIIWINMAVGAISEGYYPEITG